MTSVTADESVMVDGKIDMSKVNAIAFAPYHHGRYDESKSAGNWRSFYSIVVYNEISHTSNYIGKDKEGKRVRKQLEVDFVVNQGNQRYYIQVAYDMTSEEKQTQEFNSLRNIPDSFKKIVIVNGSKKPWRNDEGFVIMGMKYFLLNSNSLEF